MTRAAGALLFFSLIGCGSDPASPPRDDAGSDDLDASTTHEGDAGHEVPGEDAGTDAAVWTDAGTPADGAWFASRAPLDLQVAGPLGDAFAAAYAGLPDGIFPPVRVKDPFAGTLSYAGRDHAPREAPVLLAVRGNSSLQECGFPKLKWEFEARVLDANDPFEGTKKLKLGTHCGDDEEVNGTIGRFCNERSTYREELVYQLARALGIVTLETRPAVVHYTDTSSEPAFAGVLTRKAFLLEHIDELARRLGGVALKDPQSCGDMGGTTQARDVLRVKFFHAMVGNWDFQVGSIASGGCDALWNTEVVVGADGAVTLVPADFDLSAMVVGQLRSGDAIDATSAEGYARDNLTTNLEGESAEAVAAMASDYRAQRTQLEAAIDASLVDDAGKRVAHAMIDGFFAALAD